MFIPWAVYTQRTRFETMLLGSFKIPRGVYWIFQKLFILGGFDMGEVTFLVHMHQHGFLIPDVEYLVDPKGFLAYLGLKVKRYYMCLYCNDGCHPSGSLEAYGSKNSSQSALVNGGNDEEAGLKEFYDYSSSLLQPTHMTNFFMAVAFAPPTTGNPFPLAMSSWSSSNSQLFAFLQNCTFSKMQTLQH